jgi:organic radical activating enzyme
MNENSMFIPAAAAKLANLIADMEAKQKPLLDRLDSAGRTGLDLSPGDPLAAEAAAAIRELLDGAKELNTALETIKGATKKDMQAKADKALTDAAKYREKLLRENHELYAKRKAAEEALETYKQQVVKDASTIEAVGKHVQEPEKECICPVCRMHQSTASLRKNIEELKATIEGDKAIIEGHKAKNKELKDALKSFQGPRSKKEKENAKA